jgi:MFS family permease
VKPAFRPCGVRNSRDCLARACQGTFGALLAPAGLSLLTTTFPGRKERGQAFGVYGAIVASGSAVGLPLGGVLTEYLSWRWCLYINLVFAAPASPEGRCCWTAAHRQLPP